MNFKHWCGASGIFCLKAATVLEFGVLNPVPMQP
jgi:hypothetical protein